MPLKTIQVIFDGKNSSENDKLIRLLHDVVTVFIRGGVRFSLIIDKNLPGTPVIKFGSIVASGYYSCVEYLNKNKEKMMNAIKDERENVRKKNVNDNGEEVMTEGEIFKTQLQGGPPSSQRRPDNIEEDPLPPGRPMPKLASRKAAPIPDDNSKDDQLFKTLLSNAGVDA